METCIVFKNCPKSNNNSYRIETFKALTGNNKADSVRGRSKLASLHPLLNNLQNQAYNLLIKKQMVNK